MAVGKEIRNKIKSIESTQKITRAMEMVATSKMRKAQDRMEAARPYAEKIRRVFLHLAAGHPEYRHPYMIERSVVKRVGYIVITTDRGLCGGLNINLFRALLRHMRPWRDQGVGIDMSIIGKKGVAFFKRLDVNVIAAATNIGDLPDDEVVRGPVAAMLQAYEEGQVDRVFGVRNEFVNTMTQRPVINQAIPAPIEEAEEEIKKHRWDYIYEPDAKELLNELIRNGIRATLYRGVVENIACEMAARMVAMKSATDNATNLIDELQLVYNKARQAAITQELSEIVSGAAAV
jgi:F-type H+-transporting ATPase subunit gamma